MKPIWLRNYQPGVPDTIDPDKFTSLNAMFTWACNQYKDLPAFINRDQTLTYAQIDAQARAFCAYLHSRLGIVKGDRFAIMMPNILQYPIALIGILRTGAIVVNVNILFNEDELRQQLRDSGSTGLIISENFAHLAAKVLRETTIKHVIVTKFSDMYTGPKYKSFILDFILKFIKRKVPKYRIKKHFKFKKILKIGATIPYHEVQVNSNDIALLQYTGGTTGIPKGAMLTHRNLLANTLQLSEWASPILEPGKEVTVTILPLFHISGIVTCFLTFFYNGALNILITKPLDTKEFVTAVKPYKITMLAGMNRLFDGLLNEPGFDQLDFSALKVTVGSGMAIQPSVAVQWKRVTKVTLLQAYSQTETSLGISCCPFNANNGVGTVGIPLPSTEISIRNDLGAELDIDYPGEIWVRGPQVMRGYWQNVSATSEVLTNDGWFKTGDVGMINENGFLKLIDRKKDVIYIMGFQVFPSEVEGIIMGMPGIIEVAIVDAYDVEEGEIVKAYAVAKDPSLTAQQVIAHCAKHLAYYKVPKVVEFRDDLPKNSIGKILRRALRSDYWTFG